MAAKRKTPTKGKEPIVLKKMDVRRTEITLVGRTPLLVHAFGQKMRDQMADKQANPGTKAKKKMARDPEAEYEAAFYRDVKGRPCIPSVGIKNCIVTAAYRFYDVTKVSMNGTLFIGGDSFMEDGAMSCEIQHEDVQMVRHVVRLSGPSRTADLRYRPMFTGWKIVVPLEYDASYIATKDIAEYVRRAGRSVGLCEWRPEKGGEYGTFTLEGLD